MTLFYSASTGGFYDDAIHASPPTDAVVIGAAQHTALLEAQSEGMLISPDASGQPVARDRPALTADELLAALRRRRDKLLAESDWTQFPDSPLSTEVRAVWAIYRQALRDLPETANLNAIEWPVAPL